MIRVAVVGFGAMGRELVRRLLGDDALQVAQIVVRTPGLADASCLAAQLAPAARVGAELDVSDSARPDLVAECGGHGAIVAHVLPALEAGVQCVVASVGALAHVELEAQLRDAARRGRTSVRLIAGAVGGIDALAAAQLGGIDQVTYTGVKPPRGWIGTRAEQVCELASMSTPRVFFRGTAREAALTFPKNANVAATIALAGLGFDRTSVELVADPMSEHNVHRVRASGAFGRLEVESANLALGDNPKTSALAAFSLTRAVREAAAGVRFG